MNRILIGLIAFLTVGSAQTPSQASQPTVETGPDVDLFHHLRRSTVSLGIRYSKDGKDYFLSVGSAVVIALDEHNGVLLTAKHVLFDPGKGFFPTLMYVRLPQSEPRGQDDLGVPLLLVDPNGKHLWSGSDDADLAVIRVPPLPGYSDLHGILLSDFGDENDVYQGAAVAVLGHPELAGADYQTTPIARGGIVAWTNPNGRLDHTFLVDANIYNGNSGGPVFHLSTGPRRLGGFPFAGTPKLIGIVSKDAIEEAPVHVGNVHVGAVNPKTGVVEPYTASVQNIGGIGIIEPASKAKKLITDTFGLKP